MDALPADCQELNAARLSRYEIVDMMFKTGFEEVAVGMCHHIRGRKGVLKQQVLMCGSFPRIRTNTGGTSTVYIGSSVRSHTLDSARMSLTPSGVEQNPNKPYDIDFRDDRKVRDDRRLVCKYGSREQAFRMDIVSNSPFEEVSHSTKNELTVPDRVPAIQPD